MKASCIIYLHTVSQLTLLARLIDRDFPNIYSAEHIFTIPIKRFTLRYFSWGWQEVTLPAIETSRETGPRIHSVIVEGTRL